VLADRYRLDRKLGAGNYGAVYLAQHLDLEKAIAVKVLQTTFGAEQEAVARFRREGVAACRIKHPNAVAILDFGITAGGVAFLVMELLEGRSLTDRVKAEGPLPLPDVLHLLEGVLEPLGAAHRAGVIHRDLKPSNVFVVGEPPGRVKLLDFGIARREGREGDPLTAPSMALGSVGFMAPEQLMGQAVPASDLYAVGCLGFLLATARPVFSLKNIPEAARLHLSQPPPKVRALRPDVPELFEAWVDMLLAKDVAARPRTAEAALNALRAVRQDFEAHAKKTDVELASMAAITDGAIHKRTEVVAALQPTRAATTPSKGAGPVPKGPPPERPTTVEPDTADEAHRATDSDTTLLDS
jgi:serine/threonine-protein kinase